MRLRSAALVAIAALLAAACGSEEAADLPAPNDASSAAPSTSNVEMPSTTEPPPSTSNVEMPSTTEPPPSTSNGEMPSTTEPPPSTTTPITAHANPPTTAAVGTTTPVASTTTTPPMPDCTRVDDFEADLGTWVVVNDGVMGGLSDGRLTIADSVLRFSGTVVTRGGGFTSVRLRLDGDELAGSSHIVLRARVDDRTYGLTYEDDATFQGRRVSHRADLIADSPVDDEGYQLLELGHADLRPSIFGRAVDSAPFDPDAAREIGIIIADGIDGDFALDVDWIDACR